MLDMETLRDLFDHLSHEDRKECVDELSRLEISEQNAVQVYNVLKVLETGLDVNMAIQVRAICRKLEARFPGKFSFEFLTSQPVLKHLARHETQAPEVDTSKGFKICPFCTENIPSDARECLFCQASFEKHTCRNCGRHSYESIFCIWCGALMQNPAWQKATLTKRVAAVTIDALLLAVPVVITYFSSVFPHQIALVAVAIYTAFILAGSSPGKRATGLFLMNPSGGNQAGTFQVLFREIPCRLLSLALLGLGFFWGLFDENGQTWHDILAKSIVVQRLDHD